MGFGLIKKKGTKLEMIMMDVLLLNKIKDPYLKLQKIFDKTSAIIDHYHPDEVALEAPFFGKNVQSMLKLGRAQGVAMAAALQREVPVTEYAPLKIKKSITGRGAASKEQVAGMLMQMWVLSLHIRLTHLMSQHLSDKKQKLENAININCMEEKEAALLIFRVNIL